MSAAGKWRKYTQEERDFFQSCIPGHTYKEIQEAFTERFGWEIAASQVKGYMGNNRINNGLTGRFPKGHAPQNKGRKGSCPAGSEKGWFRTGNVPANHRQPGSERVCKDGYVMVKVREPNVWKQKQRIAWEEAHGPVPQGKCIIFLNGDKADARLENLMLIDRKANVRLNQSGMRFADADSTMAAVHAAELASALGDARRKSRKKKKEGKNDAGTGCRKAAV